jgi:formylglycine-generating enzyme required for sulfatase activity
MMDTSVYPEFREIPAGDFVMGDIWGDGEPDERPLRRRFVARFLLTECTVTNSQYAYFLNQVNRSGPVGESWIDTDNPRNPIVRHNREFGCLDGFEDHPATYVSWIGAEAFCSWWSERTPYHLRVPDEAEWQYAALGSQGNKWSHGDVFERHSYVTAQDGPGPARTGRPTSWGLYNMTGNVFEWCADEYCFTIPQERASADRLSENRVIKGGSFILSDSANFRNARRFSCHQESCLHSIGFRIAANIH